MLKACWECIAGDQPRQTEDRYNVQMNGGSSAPPWQPSGQFGKMFTVPTQLKENDQIGIKGIMRDGMLDIALRPDASNHNIVCEFNVIYPKSEEPHDQILITNTHNGISQTFHQLTATEYFSGPTFDITILLYNGLEISADGTPVESVPLQHSFSDIRFISVIGDVSELNFKFNSDERSNSQYSTYVNGVSSNGTLLEMYGNNKMFTVPTTLREDTVIIIKGNMTDGMLDIALRPDGGQYNIVCNLNVLCNGGQDRILISSVQNGKDQTFHEMKASDYFYNSQFNIGFTLLSGYISISADGTPVEDIPLQHSLDDIRFISVTGEVNELNFIFNSLNGSI